MKKDGSCEEVCLSVAAEITKRSQQTELLHEDLVFMNDGGLLRMTPRFVWERVSPRKQSDRFHPVPPSPTSSLTVSQL